MEERNFKADLDSNVDVTVALGRQGADGEIAVLEIGQRDETITMQYSQNATADVDEVFVPERAQRPVHVNCGQAERIGQMALAERHDNVAVQMAPRELRRASNSSIRCAIRSFAERRPKLVNSSSARASSFS